MSVSKDTFTFIRALELENPGRKTRRWELYAENGGLLGYVEWFTRWRKYTFRPTTTDTTWFEQTCLREIALFIEAQTKEHKAA